MMAGGKHPEATRTVTCTNHCSRCGRHFHSVEAFDAHRTGDHRSTDPETQRRCLAPCEVLDASGRQRLEALTAGECRMYEDVVSAVNVWTVRGSAEDVGRRFSEGPLAPGGKRESASSAPAAVVPSPWPRSPNLCGPDPRRRQSRGGRFIELLSDTLSLASDGKTA